MSVNLEAAIRKRIADIREGRELEKLSWTHSEWNDGFEDGSEYTLVRLEEVLDEFGD